MINIFEVNETNNMVEHENLDVRTITIGISLLECITDDLKQLNENIYNRITTVAKDLDRVAGEIEDRVWHPDRKPQDFCDPDRTGWWSSLQDHRRFRNDR